MAHFQNSGFLAKQGVLQAIILPFFNDLVGFIGAIGFWPLTVYFPIVSSHSSYLLLTIQQALPAICRPGSDFT